jgi:hypothetical protein
MATKYDNVHFEKGVCRDVIEIYNKITGHIANNEISNLLTPVQTEKHAPWTSSYNEIIPIIQSPHTKRFKMPFLAKRQGEDDYVILRPGDTFANIAFKAHISFGEMYNKIIYFYAYSYTFISDVGPQNMLTLPIIYMIEEAQKHVEHIAENHKPLSKYIPNDVMEEVDEVDANDAADANGPDDDEFSD